MSYQDSTPVDRHLLAAKSRVAPKEMSILCLELVATHTLAKLENSVSQALASFPITADHTWVDSITVTCWLANGGEWTTSVHNRVKIIGEFIESGTWRYVPATENPSDLGTRGSESNKLKEFWLRDQASYRTSPQDLSNQPFWKRMRLKRRDTRKKCCYRLRTKRMEPSRTGQKAC